MAWQGVSRGRLISVWKLTMIIVILLFSTTVGADATPRALMLSSGGFNDDIRGAVIMFARNHDIDSVLFTMSQLRDAHSDKPSTVGDWVFYSDENISDEFKVLTSNLTHPGAAFYEYWGKGDLALKGWNIAALSQHKRLRNYNWVWSITPGTGFHSKIGFDTFEAMKADGMIYGSSTSGLLQVRPGFTNSKDSDTTARGFPRGIREVQWNIKESPNAGDGLMTLVDDPARFGSVAPGSSPSWLALVYAMCSVCWDFEIAWIDLFRNMDYLKVANYITSTLRAELVDDDVPLAPSSTTSFRSKVQTKNASYDGPQGLIAHRDGAKATTSMRPRTGVFYLLGNPDDDISSVHERWMNMAHDFDEQGKTPGLRAGRTSVFWRATVFTTRGRRARAWLFREGEEIPSALIPYTGPVEEDDERAFDDDED